MLWSSPMPTDDGDNLLQQLDDAAHVDAASLPPAAADADSSGADADADALLSSGASVADSVNSSTSAASPRPAALRSSRFRGHCGPHRWPPRHWMAKRTSDSIMLWSKKSTQLVHSRRKWQSFFASATRARGALQCQTRRSTRAPFSPMCEYVNFIMFASCGAQFIG